MRTERDFLGQRTLPTDCLYGIETLRARENFPLAGRSANRSLLHAIALVKRCAAQANAAIGALDQEKAAAICAACDELIAGKYDESLVTDALQGGAGTSTNMNVNEVAANLALKKLGMAAGRYDVISPLDDVNMGQSTNDVYPTALRIAAITAVRALSDQCAALQEALQRREQEFAGIVKLGRTELTDAVPVTLGQEFGAYAQAIARDRWRIYKSEERLRMVNIGGTAVGAPQFMPENAARRQYAFQIIALLQEQTGIGLARAEYPMDVTQNQDVFAEVSGFLKALAVNLMKLCGDLRLLSSGPHGGLGELRLAPLQAGSTIMPGKVNPVIPEAVTQAAIRVMANDTAIAFAAASGNLELNAFMPLIADSLLESLELLVNAVKMLREKCIDTLSADPARCLKNLTGSPTWYATVLAPHIGYAKAAALLAQTGADAEKIKTAVLAENLLSAELLDALLDAAKFDTI
ncbi:MAG: aspartate ammonia-lyase [Oscillospiraceae bacterium]